MTQDVDHGVARSAVGLSLLSLLSPITGVAVEIALAGKLGASATMDAYRIASIVTAFGWQFFIVDIMPILIVPLIARSRSRGKEIETWTIPFSIGNLSLIPTTVICLVTFARPGPALALLAPGLVGSGKASAVLFVRCFALTFIPLVWAGVATGILYAKSVFWVPVGASIGGNLVILIALLAARGGGADLALVTGTLAASLLTLVLFMITLLLLMRRAEVPLRVLGSFDLNNDILASNLARSLPLMALVFVGQAASIAINRVLSREPSGTLATFGYAWKLLALVSLVPGALAVVMFPRFAQARFSSAPDGFRTICTKALRMGLYIALPLAGACFALRFPLTLLLFRRGAFSLDAAATTSHFFGLLLLAAPATAFSTYLQRIFYAAQDTFTPSLIQSAAFLLQVIFAPLIGGKFGGEGLCLLVAVTQLLVCTLLSYRLSSTQDALQLKGMAAFASELLLLTLVSVWAGCHSASFFLSASQIQDALAVMIRIAVTSGFIAAIFIALTLLLRLPEALEWPRYLRSSGSSILRFASFRSRHLVGS